MWHISRTSTVVMIQHFTPVWWIVKESLGIIPLGIVNDVTSLVKPRPNVKCVPPYIIKWIVVSFHMKEHNRHNRLA